MKDEGERRGVSPTCIETEGSNFPDRLALAWPPADWADVTVLVAVSGGPDSLALLLALKRLKTGGTGRLLAAHFNHGTRGRESDADEAFVVETCRQLQISCEVGRATPGQFGHLPNGFEAAAREARYRFLEQTAERLGARYVATGHTADDQAETVLHRILRGTGIAGLAGIPRVRPLNGVTTLIRPLLSIRRSEVLAYLAELKQPYRTDASNLEPQFTRNRLRHELIPHLGTKYNSQVVDALLRLGSLAGEAQDVIDEQVAELIARAVRYEGDNSAVIDCRELAGVPEYLSRELLVAVWRRFGWPEQDMDYEKWHELAGNMRWNTPFMYKLPGNVRAERKEQQLRLSRR